MRLSNYFIVIVVVLGVAMVSFADFTPPSAHPPESNIAPPVHTGNIPQVRRGALGIQIAPADLVMPAGVGLYTDSAIGVQHHKYTAANSSWTMDAESFALDTNAPISVHGVFSTGPIQSSKSITAPVITVEDLKLSSSADYSRRVCADTATGKLVACTDAVGSQLQAYVSISPTTVVPGTANRLTIQWQATPSATSCTALQGDGFSTGGETWGSDSVTGVILAEGQTAEFVVACSDIFGNTRIASAQLVAVPQAPKIAFSINPAIGSWAKGSFFTTGVSVDPNGGGSMQCRKKIDGAAVSAVNNWSGQVAGVWSSVITIPPGNAQSLNTCHDGCQFKSVLTEPLQSALLTVQCTNAHATTTESRWISAGQ